jgi:hypothetical protein
VCIFSEKLSNTTNDYTNIMADWRNKLDMITNKVKNQLFAKGVDNLEQLKGIFLVSRAPLTFAFGNHGMC